MDPITLFGAAVLITTAIERALREPAQAKRKHKLGLRGDVTLLDCLLALTPEQAEEMKSKGALNVLISMMRNGEYIRGGAK